MDRVAKAVGLSPEEFRRRNLLRTGETTATGQKITQPLDLVGLQSRALQASNYHEKIELFHEHNAKSTRKKGIGFSTFFHGAGFTGSGERILASMLEIEATESGKVRILASMTEMGQGTNTILAQIAAEALHLPYEMVEVLRPDTSQVLNTGPTVASRTSMIVGKMVENGALDLRKKLIESGFLGSGYTADEFATAAAEYAKQFGPLRVRVSHEPPPGVFWDDQKYQGEAYGAYAWATYVAEVTVDTVTGEVQVDDFVAAQEVGRVLHPVLASGQIEGGVVQGIGLALYEKVVWNNGGMANNQMTNYVIPTSVDVPPITVLFEEIPYQYGAMGAKGIGELPMDGPAPAVLNAVENALGISFHHVPLLPEEILERLGELHEAEASTAEFESARVVA